MLSNIYFDNERGGGGWGKVDGAEVDGEEVDGAEVDREEVDGTEVDGRKEGKTDPSSATNYR